MERMMRNTLEGMTLTGYFEKWWATSTGRMEKAGVSVQITLVDFLTKVVTPRQYASLQKTFDAGWLNFRQNDSNPLAYVITWKSYAARSTNVYDLSTACFCTRAVSRMLALPKKGDPLRPEHREAISKALAGKEKSEEHAAAISEALTGRTLSDEHKANLRRPKRPWTDERKRAARDRALIREAAKRGQR